MSSPRQLSPSSTPLYRTDGIPASTLIVLWQAEMTPVVSTPQCELKIVEGEISAFTAGKHQPVGDMPVIGFHETINHRILFLHQLLAEAKQH